MNDGAARLARLVAAAAANTSHPQLLEELADLALSMGRWGDAAVALERVLTASGSLSDPLAARLVAAWAPLGKHESTVQYLEKLATDGVRIGPELLRAAQDALESALRAGKVPLARAGFTSLAKASGDDSAVVLRLAELELDAGAIDAATERLARVTQSQPGHVLARLLTRRAAGLRAGRNIAELELLIARAPYAGGGIAFTHEGTTYHGAPSAAFADALAQRDDLVENELYVTLGRYRLERGEIDLALRALQKARGAEPFLLPELAALKSRIWARKGHPDLALEELTSVPVAELVRGEQRDGLMLLMDLLESHQRAPEALAVARQAIRLGGEEMTARLRRLELTARTQLDAPEGEGTPPAVQDGAGTEDARPAGPAIPPGTVIHGNYEVMSELGRGGMGVVLKVRNRKLDRIEALKLLAESTGADAGAYERLVKEAKLLAGLSHPAIVRVFALGRHEGRPFLAMELLDGETLGARLRNAGRMPLPEALQIARAVAVGLQAAHAGGIVHRDVKPDNVMLLKGSRAAKLMDFGLAQDLGSSSGVKRESFMGTIHYISPEQINGQDVGPRADVYSFGVVLYEMLTGQAPFDSPNPHNLMFMHLTKAAPSPRLLRPEISGALERLVLSCLEKAPAKRPADFGAVLAQLPTEGA